MTLNPIATERTKRLMKYLAREYGKNADFTITLVAPRAAVAVVVLSYNRFLDCSSRREYDIMAVELMRVCEDHGDALAVEEGDSYFGGALASSLIQPGKTIDCDSLMSRIEIQLMYPATSR